MNRITISGNLVADPQLKFANSGKPYARLRVAESRGEGRETTFFDVTAFDSLAENVVDSLTKGAKVNIEGYFSGARTYTTEAGETRVALDVVANEVSPSLHFAKATIVRTPKREEANGVHSLSQYDDEEEIF